MKILFLAPQPFFQERGTPIAVRLALSVLSQRNTESVTLLSYHEGASVPLDRVDHRRIVIPRLLQGWIRAVGPGISIKKLVCDLLFLLSSLRLVAAAKRQGTPFQLVHAVEESVFIAYLIKLLWRIPYIYDMDSSLAMQLTEKWPVLSPLRFLLERLERLAVRGSIAVVPVCDSLAAIAHAHGSPDTHILRDISLLDLPSDSPGSTIDEVDLRSECGAREGEVLALYIGNLEPYQGINLLIDSAARIANLAFRIVVIGGAPDHITVLRERVATLALADRVTLLGPRPVSLLSTYLAQSDILVSPRIRGNNTPMKIYSYLHAGRAILATDLATHNQVLDSEVSILTAPDPDAFAAGMRKLIIDPELRERLGQRSRERAQSQYTFPVFAQSLNELYDRVLKNRSKSEPSTP